MSADECSWKFSVSQKTHSGFMSIWRTREVLTASERDSGDISVTLASPCVIILIRFLIEEVEQSGRIITEVEAEVMRGEIIVGLNSDNRYLLTAISSLSPEIIVQSVGRLPRQSDTDWTFSIWSLTSA